MNFPNTIKSPRASMTTISSTLPNTSQLAPLQQALLEREQTISNLQGIINKLELKNKQCASYQQAMIQYQAKAEDLQNELIKVNEKLRAKVSQSDQLRKKLDVELKEKKDRATTFVRHEDYMKMANDFKKFKDVHRACDNSIKAIEKTMEDQKGAAEMQTLQLKEELKTLGKIIQTKNQQINSLKLEKYNLKVSQQVDPQKDMLKKSNSNTNIISSFRIIGDEYTLNSNHTEKINHELFAYSRENDELRKKVHRLEQELDQCMRMSKQVTFEKNPEYSKLIQEYEANISNMASKLGTLHRIQMQKNSIQRQRTKYQVQCQALRQQLSSRNSYCQQLQQKMRESQHYKSAYLQTDLQNYILRNQKLCREVQRLEASVNQKYQIIMELKKKVINVKVTEDMFMQVQASLTALEGSLRATQEELRKEQDKVLDREEDCHKLQKEVKKMEIQMNEVKAEMAKTNRLASQKVQKIQLQSAEIKRLEKQNGEKTDLSRRLASLQVQHKRLQKKYEDQLDQCNQLAMSYFVLSAQIQRRQITGNITKQFISQFQTLKQKSKQTESYSKHLQQKVQRLQHLHKQVVNQTIKVSQHLHLSHKRWNHYDTAMEGLIKYLEEQDMRSIQKYDQLDGNITTWLSLQEIRLRELAKNDKLGGDGDCGDGGYVKYTERVTTRPMSLEELQEST